MGDLQRQFRTQKAVFIPILGDVPYMSLNFAWLFIASLTIQRWAGCAGNTSVKLRELAAEITVYALIDRYFRAAPLKMPIRN
jgi:hypothetical protein